MQAQTKLPSAANAVALGDQIDGWRVLGGRLGSMQDVLRSDGRERVLRIAG